MSLFSLLSIGRDGMMAQQGALHVTGENVTNVNTPGYVRRSPLLATRGIPGAPQGGVELQSVTRSFDIFAYRQVVAERGKQGSAEARTGALGELESLLVPGEGLGIDARMGALFSSFDTLSTDADDPTARKVILSRAVDLAASVRETAGQLTTQRQDLATRAEGVAEAVNGSLTRIAELNRHIAMSEASGQPASDLRDQRDELIKGLSDKTGARVIEDAAGKMTIFAMGTVLLEGDVASSVGVGLAPSGDLSFTVTRPSGATLDVTNHVGEGQLGGLREARDVDVKGTADELDQFAFDLMNAINGVHTGGVGLDGVGGRPLFAPPAAVAGAAWGMVVDPSVAGQPDAIAASSLATGLPGGNDVAVALAQLEAQTMGAWGTPAESFSVIAAGVGVKKNAAEAELSLRTATTLQAEAHLEQGAGVSLEEEMVNLSRYQTAFEASTRVLQVADELLESLIREL